MKDNQGSNSEFDVAIVGGGFSGLMVLYQLVSRAPPQSRFAIFEPRSNLGEGIAYSTQNDNHLLNVLSARMSALPDRADHFTAWLSANGYNSFVNGYAPRRVYGLYLRSLAKGMETIAKERVIHVVHFREKILSCTKKGENLFSLFPEKGEIVSARKIVIATGNNSAGSEISPYKIDNIWSFDFSELTNSTHPVGIVGTGLTMIDTVLSLRSAGYKGKIYAASRHGLLPRAHKSNTGTQKQPPAVDPDITPKNLSDLLKALKNSIKNARDQEIVWQEVVDSWRPHIQTIWRTLPVAQKKRFFSKYFTLWNVHRHRMAPAIASEINRETSSGGLVVLKGSGALLKNFGCRTIFDCRGPCYDITKIDNKLIADIYAQKIIRADDSGLGIHLEADRYTPGAPHDNIFFIGSLAIGALLETTAVPELRVQAQKIALRCLE